MDWPRDVSNICFLLHTRDVCWEERGCIRVQLGMYYIEKVLLRMVFTRWGTLPSTPTSASLLLSSPGCPAQLPEQPDCPHLPQRLRAREKALCCIAIAQDAQPVGRTRLQPHGQHGRLSLLWLWLFLHPCVIAGRKMAQSQGTFQRRFSNSHYPQCKDHRPAFSSTWLLFRPKFQSSVDAFFQLKEEGGWVLLGLSLAKRESAHALHVLYRLIQSPVDTFPLTSMQFEFRPTVLNDITATLNSLCCCWLEIAMT